MADVIEQSIVVEVDVPKVKGAREEGDVHAHVSSVYVDVGRQLGRIVPFGPGTPQARRAGDLPP